MTSGVKNQIKNKGETQGTWSLSSIHDRNADGKSDLTLQNQDGAIRVILLNGLEPLDDQSVLDSPNSLTIYAE